MSLEKRLRELKKTGVTINAVGYARFSSENQREESIDAQVRAIKEFAASYGLNISKFYVDKARSGTSDDRDEFQQMISDSARKDFQFIIVHKLDRFARNRRDSMGYRIQLRKNGVNLISVLESFDEDTPEGKLMEGMVELLAEFYSLNLAREVKKGLKENALKARHTGGLPPFGYDVDPNSKKLVVNKHEAQGVKMIFDMVIRHYSYNDIVDKLNELGYKSKNGNYFRKTAIYDILRNPKYYGLYFYRRTKAKDYYTKSRNNHAYNAPEDMIIVPDGVPAIISKEDFDKVQQILDARKYHKSVFRREQYLLSGKIVCGMCGAAYSGNRKKTPNPDKPYITYRCNNRQNRTGIVCSNKEVNRDMIEQTVLNLLADIVFDEKIVPKIYERYKKLVFEDTKKVNDNLKRLKQRLEEIEKSIKNILKAIEVSESTILLDRLEELEKEKGMVNEKIKGQEAQTKPEEFDFELVKNTFNEAKKLFKKGSLQETKQLIGMFLDKVVVHEDRIEVIFNAVPFYFRRRFTNSPKLHYNVNRNLIRIKQWDNVGRG